MNFKLLFPTYRNRYRFVEEQLSDQQVERALHLGTGEGDYDPLISPHCQSLIACDINEQDLEYARQLNASLENVDYRMEDALDLSFPSNSFDLLVTVEVMEHVGDPARMTAEISRVLKEGGIAIVVFPQTGFPWTYDPINRLLLSFGTKNISQGAYAFGHEYLVDPEAFKKWAVSCGLEIVLERSLSGHLVGLLEMYWTGWVQWLLKDNARNISQHKEKRLKVRPSHSAPFLVKFTDAILWLDRRLFGRSKRSIGKGFVVKKNKQGT